MDAFVFASFASFESTGGFNDYNVLKYNNGLSTTPNLEKSLLSIPL